MQTKKNRAKGNTNKRPHYYISELSSLNCKILNNVRENRLKEHKKAIQKYSHKSIAKYCKVSSVYISMILSGRRKCPDKLYKKILIYLDKY